MMTSAQQLDYSHDSPLSDEVDRPSIDSLSLEPEVDELTDTSRSTDVINILPAERNDVSKLTLSSRASAFSIASLLAPSGVTNQQHAGDENESTAVQHRLPSSPIHLSSSKPSSPPALHSPSSRCLIKGRFV
jgi:hypothetical protein